jgi:hypothetical protein
MKHLGRLFLRVRSVHRKDKRWRRGVDLWRTCFGCVSIPISVGIVTVRSVMNTFMRLLLIYLSLHIVVVVISGSCGELAAWKSDRQT